MPLPDVDLGRLDVGVLAPSYVQTFVTFRQDVDWPIPPSYELRLRPAVRIGGWVRDEAGSAVPGAEILVNIPGSGDASGREPKRERVGFPGNLPVAKTDADGRWIFASLPPELENFSIEGDFTKCSRRKVRQTIRFRADLNRNSQLWQRCVTW